jgi:hypothetical protein
MSFSYSGNPQNSPIDELRFRLSDTNGDDFFLSDEELDYMLFLAEGNVRKAYVNGLRQLVMKTAGLRDESVGEVSIKYSQMFRQYRQLLQDEIASTAGFALDGGVFAGGIFTHDKQNNKNRIDTVKPKFEKDLGTSRFLGG